MSDFVQTAADGKPERIEGYGDDILGSLPLQNALYVPTFGKNLISGPQLMSEGYKIVLEGKISLQLPDQWHYMQLTNLYAMEIHLNSSMLAFSIYTRLTTFSKEKLKW